MNKYMELYVDGELYDRMTHLCNNPDDSIEKDTTIFDREVVFDDGRRTVIQVCSPISNEECWTQGVLLDNYGIELGRTDLGESFGGEYLVYVNNIRYCVEVIRKDVHPFFDSGMATDWRVEMSMAYSTEYRGLKALERLVNAVDAMGKPGAAHNYHACMELHEANKAVRELFGLGGTTENTDTVDAARYRWLRAQNASILRHTAYRSDAACHVEKTETETEDDWTDRTLDAAMSDET